MKKVLTLLAVTALVGFVSCSKPTPTPTPDPKPDPQPEKKDPVTATITASDVTVEEGKTVKIEASTNSSATITFETADASIATVAADGTVTGVKAGNTTITLKVAEVKDEFTAAEKKINVTVKGAEAPQLKEITIDGDFSDWAALDKGTFSQTFGDEEATHPALICAKVYALADYVYVYIEWDTDLVSAEASVPNEETGELEGGEYVPFHCYINTDGDESTGGFADQFSDACTDVLFEGFLYDGGEYGGEMGSYDPGAFAWAGDPNASGWAWDDLGGEGLCQGAGIDGKYEFLIDRAAVAALGFPIADVFSIGFDIQQSWDSVGILPSAAASEDNPSGIMPSLKVTTQK